MNYPVAACPLCKGTRASLFDQRGFHGFQISNQLCSQCGLVYQSPRMSDEKLGEFYEDEYRILYQGQAGPDPKDLSIQAARAEALLVLAQQHIQQVNRHLDIGSSAGLLLQRFQAEYGCYSAGIEPGEAYRTYSREKGLSVYSSLDDLHASGEDSFDLISLAHVLEHLPDPVGYLGRLRQDFLKEDGWLLVEVPNLYAHDCFEVAHLISFSPHTLLQTLKTAGFEAQLIQEQGLPRSRIIPLYIQVLARVQTQPQETQIEPERWVRPKRRWGMTHRRVLTRLLPRQAWIPIQAE